MQYLDRVYGQAVIEEPILLDLINSQALQRLKHIDQAGYYEPHFPGTAYSRFEHSLGDFLLLKKYNAPLAEQIAGLIHDVSHSAFSHCIDYALEGCVGETQGHQDSIFNDYVRQTDIPAILKKYNLDLDHILDDKNFPLKEQDLPDLCSDRLDYSLRTAIIFKTSTPDEIQEILANLTVKDNRWVFTNYVTAKKYAELFRKLNLLYYSGLPSALMFRTVGDYLKHALQKKYIEVKNLYTTDKEVLDKINLHLDNDAQLRLLFDRMNNKVETTLDEKNYDARVACKSRVVDPLCQYEGQIKRVSEIDPAWKEITQKENGPREFFIKFAR
jgi:hypothetical protein